jgi:hypothetical protein
MIGKKWCHSFMSFFYAFTKEKKFSFQAFNLFFFSFFCSVSFLILKDEERGGRREESSCVTGHDKSCHRILQT